MTRCGRVEVASAAAPMIGARRKPPRRSGSAPALRNARAQAKWPAAGQGAGPDTARVRFPRNRDVPPPDPTSNEVVERYARMRQKLSAATAGGSYDIERESPGEAHPGDADTVVPARPGEHGGRGP